MRNGRGSDRHIFGGGWWVGVVWALGKGECYNWEKGKGKGKGKDYKRIL